MTGIVQTGSQIQLNSLTGVAIPLVQSSAPTWVPGLYWINSSSGYSVNTWNGSSWVAAGNPYLALLTADPSGLTSISALSEVTTSGYSRVQVSFNPASSVPCISSNASLVTFGPFTANMVLPAQWLALVSVASGTTGQLMNTWTMQVQQQVSATEVITIAAGALQITNS